MCGGGFSAGWNGPHHDDNGRAAISLRDGGSSVQALALDEGLGGAVGGIDEDDVLRIAPGGVDRQDDEGFLKDLWCAVNSVLLEEDKLPGADFKRLGIAEKKRGAAADHEEVFVTGGVIVRWSRPVHAKDARTSVVLVGQTCINQHGVGGGGEVSGDFLDVKQCSPVGRSLLFLFAHESILCVIR